MFLKSRILYKSCLTYIIFTSLVLFKIIKCMIFTITLCKSQFLHLENGDYRIILRNACKVFSPVYGT